MKQPSSIRNEKLPKNTMECIQRKTAKAARNVETEEYKSVDMV